MLYIKVLSYGYTLVTTISSMKHSILRAHSIATGERTIRSTFIITSMAVYSCQTFYCFRVFLIGPRYRWLVIPAVVSMTTGFSFGLVAGVEAFVFVRELTELHRISWMVSVAYGFAVSSDLILTGALVFVLQQSRTGSRSILDTLIIYTINTGLLTSIVSVFAFVFALVIPGNLIYAAVSIVGAKLYANSVLALLNSRRSIDNRYMDDFTTFNISGLNTPERTQAHRGESDTMVWNVRQVSTCMSQTTSISQGMTFATGTTPHTSDVNISV
ncbi:hypothetical protein PYCCODRAFT_807312 [Trametes coccinea BRFM310]|uniref:DUF6534 domain-containing protein n=1 Tax=Trametes coccinea (strain BRFM310) TaxID=1353009 RepID=A0A1Y2IH03_TRAC3|nr:hypothetical protein PYCCODRAFT_807312 [Trametes coccinea BRFM310]